MSSILIVEDDPILGRSLIVSLELEKYRVTWSRDLKNARDATSKGHFDLVILDINLPDGSGLELCASIRKNGLKMPIIFLTAQTDEDSVVAGFTAGANDYVKKPFGSKELSARIKVALREPLKPNVQSRFGDLILYPDQRKVSVDGKEIDFNRREFDILKVLMQHPEAVVTREMLLSSLDKEGEIFDRTIDSHVSHIRSKLKKLEIDSIRVTSVYGIGYRLEKK